MILAIDIGNSNIVIGGIDSSKTYFVERVNTNHRKTELEYAVNIKDIMDLNGFSISSIEGSIVSSVVPPLTEVILSAVRKLTGATPLLVGSGMKTGLNIKMDNPKSVGSDLIVDAVAALKDFTPPIIVIDMGTATTVSVIDQHGNFTGESCPHGDGFTGVFRNLSQYAGTGTGKKLPDQRGVFKRIIHIPDKKSTQNDRQKSRHPCPDFFHLKRSSL